MKPARIVLTILLLGAGFAGGFGYGRWYGKGSAPSAKDGRKILYYVDPMHPAYRSDRPGTAPDCGMKLEPVYADGGMPKTTARKILYYADPKQPAFHSDKPGMNPETGNDLEPVYETAAAIPAGSVNIAQDKQQLVGVRYGTVEMSAPMETVRAVGKIAADERSVTRVHPRIEGWIHKVSVDFMGQPIRKGDPLLTIYSPEMFASQQEFLLALKARDAMKGNPNREAYENSELLAEASRRRLELYDLSAAQIAEVEQSRKPIRTVTLYSPASGFVTGRNAFPSQRVTPETELYAITDLSHVWIMADVFETDIGKLHTGQTARVSLPYENGRSFMARVSNIQPQVDPATRTLKIRLEAQNDGLKLKPEMFVNVEFQIGTASRMTVPADAVLDSGARKTVFVDRGDGYLEPRQVQTGDRTGDRIEIRSGLKPGDRIVTSGNFLIDSESQLKSGSGGGGHD